jgi:hypothetical protein
VGSASAIVSAIWPGKRARYRLFSVSGIVWVRICCMPFLLV